MKLELKRVDPLRAANIGALVYGLLMGAFALIFFPFFLLLGILAPSDGPGATGPFFAIFMLVFYPVMGVVMGWISVEPHSGHLVPGSQTTVVEAPQPPHLTSIPLAFPADTVFPPPGRSPRTPFQSLPLPPMWKLTLPSRLLLA